MADKKITDFTSVVPTLDDLILGVDSPGGTPVTKTFTLQNIITAIHGGLFNVVNYGADTTGVADSTTAIQAAITAASAAGGGVVWFPIGTYLVSATINLATYVYLSGCGPFATIIERATDYGDTFLGTDVNYFGIYNLCMQTTIDTTLGDHISLNRCSYFELDRVNLYHQFGGICIKGGSTFFMNNLVIQLGRNWGGVINNSHYITLQKASSGQVAPTLVLLSKFSFNAAYAGIAYGILIQSLDGMWVTNGYVGLCQDGVVLNQVAAADQLTGLDMFGCWIEGQTRYGVVATQTSSGSAGLHRFASCTLYGYAVGDYGMYLMDTGMTDVQISDCVISGFVYDGIALGQSGVRISHCGITRNSQDATNTRYGININADITDISIKGCDFGFDTAASASVAHAYHIFIAVGTGDYIHIADNTYKNAGTANILNGATGVNNIVEIPTASAGALAAYTTGAFGLNSDVNMAALHALVVAMRAALISHGIMT